MIDGRMIDDPCVAFGYAGQGRCLTMNHIGRHSRNQKKLTTENTEDTEKEKRKQFSHGVAENAEKESPQKGTKNTNKKD